MLELPRRENPGVDDGVNDGNTGGKCIHISYLECPEATWLHSSKQSEQLVL